MPFWNMVPFNDLATCQVLSLFRYCCIKKDDANITVLLRRSSIRGTSTTNARRLDLLINHVPHVHRNLKDNHVT
jgi:hypothetical protein